MKQIEFPQNVTIGKEEWSAAAMIRKGVLTLPFWKEAADLKTVDACLAIEKALQLDERKPRLSDDAQSLLGRAMATAVVADSQMNAFFMQCFSAVLRAADCE